MTLDHDVQIAAVAAYMFPSLPRRSQDQLTDPA
jgi:hypothetical protein